MNKWSRITRPLATVALCGALSASLAGCFTMAVGSAVMGTLAATDRRTLGAQTEDKEIDLKGEARVSKLVGDAGHVNINSFDRRVLLTGEVPDQATKDAVQREVASIDGVESIVNDLAIMGTTSFTSRSNDTLITGKVKAAFVDNKQLYANSIKVVTERGVVYLMGRVTQREGDLAASVAAGVSGVQKVVKMFEYITEAELRQMSSTPSTQNTAK